MERTGGRGEVGLERTQELEGGSDEIERLLAVMRREMDAESKEREAAFDRWADSVYRKVLAENERERQRGTWVTRLNRWFSNLVAAFWNSRAVRLLVP